MSDYHALYGYFSVWSVYHYLGITTQVPFVYEIVTNKEKSRVRKITLKNKKIILRKPYATINRNNYLEAQFLEFINNANINDIDDNIDILKKYIKDNNLNKNIILDLITNYPSKTSKRLIESRLLYEFVW